MARAPYLMEPKGSLAGRGGAGREARAGEPRGPLSEWCGRGCRAPRAGCRGRPPPATSAGCHGNGGNFPVRAAGSGPGRGRGCESKIQSLSRGSKMDERRPPGRGGARLGTSGIPSLSGASHCQSEVLEGAEGAGDRPSAAPRGASVPGAAGQRRAAQRAPFPAAAAAAALPIAQTRRVQAAAWVAAAETPEAGSDAPGVHRGLKIQCKAPPPRPPLGPSGFCPQS